MTILENRTDAEHLAAFRTRLRESARFEDTDPQPVLSWLETLREKTEMSVEKIPLAEARQWAADPATGNVIHASGAFFSVEAVRTRAGGLREVVEWDQPIFDQPDGGVLALLSAEHDGVVSFLIQAKAEPGNIGGLQLSPTLQCTWSNLRKAHKGKRPLLAEALDDDTPGTLIYCAEHNEEGGRFWRKSNANAVIHFTDAGWVEERATDYFRWVTLSQIKNLALTDNVLSPFVKTIVAPF